VASLPASSRQLVLDWRCPFPDFGASLANVAIASPVVIVILLALFSPQRDKAKRRSLCLFRSGYEWPITPPRHSSGFFQHKYLGSAAFPQTLIGFPDRACE
jgi:hypothetical protein